ncbi:hypothetical protein [Brevundimonas sp.]|uniref:hypothetical protein n=1 Tax=Brevundimonas sp. TaxID=1871086 RepID=UPI0035AE0F99
MQKRQNLRLSAFVALAAVAAPAAWAQTPPAAPAAGGIGAPPRAAAEVPAWADRLFDGLDADADGVITGRELMVLSRGEIAARGGSRIRAMVSQSDASNDARVTREELQAGAARMFARMDADGDGRLSDAEMPRPPAPRAPVAMPMPAPEPMPMPGMDDD